MNHTPKLTSKTNIILSPKCKKSLDNVNVTKNKIIKAKVVFNKKVDMNVLSLPFFLI